MLKLNVGGHLFSTSLDTLTKDSGSMLHAMFSGRFDTKPSEDGSYFIDRDGTHFRYILNYLRTGQLIVPEDKVVHRELLAEAEFYQVQGIINKLTAVPFKDSVTVPSDQRQTLINWLKETRAVTTDNLFPVLLYRASRDGWTGARFHSFCDNKGPTVTVVKSGNYIFGGYTEEHWEGASEVTIKAQDTFLFSFEKRRALPGKEQHAVCCCFCRYGPAFRYGHDRVHVSAPNSPDTRCSVKLNGCVENSSEMEVFGFEK
ncbi:hypothetical protein ACROYT_G044297 [Oculina patagonica]